MSALLSACGCYRYRLDRCTWLPGKRRIAFIMVNPSTADASLDDATIRKVKGFSARHGFRHIMVGNLFAWRATDIRALRTVPDPVGPLNDAVLGEIVGRADLILVAWGASAKLPRPLRDRWRAVVALTGGKPLHCLGTAGDGHPLHPLTLGYDRPLSLWSPPP